MPLRLYHRREGLGDPSPQLPIVFHFQLAPHSRRLAQKSYEKRSNKNWTLVKENQPVLSDRLDEQFDIYNSRQLSLPFILNFFEPLTEEVTQLSSYVRRSLHPIMGLSFVSFVSREPKLRRIAQELYNIDIYRTGDVIQLTPEQIKGVTDATAQEIKDLEDFLQNSELQLKLGMRVIGWQSAYSSSIFSR